MSDRSHLRVSEDQLAGVVLPLGKTSRLLVVDRTDINVRTWPRFHTADLFIGARTPIVYTMSYANLGRLSDAVTAALAEFDADGR